MGFILSYSTILKFLNSENMDREWCRVGKPLQTGSLCHPMYGTKIPCTSPVNPTNLQMKRWGGD